MHPLMHIQKPKGWVMALRGAFLRGANEQEWMMKIVDHREAQY